jgi:hypothetical protein
MMSLMSKCCSGSSPGMISAPDETATSPGGSASNSIATVALNRSKDYKLRARTALGNEGRPCDKGRHLGLIAFSDNAVRQMAWEACYGG